MKNRVLTAVLATAMLFTVCFTANREINSAKAYETITGEMINVAVAVEFSDTEDADKITPEAEQNIRCAFNTDDNSLKNFIYRNSERKLSINTVFVGTVRVDVPSTRYSPRYKEGRNGYVEVNAQGYDNRNFDENGEADANGIYASIEYAYREQELLNKITERIEPSTLPNGADKDGDGYIDALTFIYSNTVKISDRGEDWGTIFWPHASRFYYGTAEELNSDNYVGKAEGEFRVQNIGNYFPLKYFSLPYSFIYDSGKLQTVTICHEFMHVLGAPDYYSYDSDDEYVGPFDIMADTGEYVQLSLSYLRFKMGWLSEGSDILAVEESGTYSLKPTEHDGDVKAYKIVLSDYFETGDCYYVECRALEGGDDTGLIIYRVNEKYGYIAEDGEISNYEYGNIFGLPEVYVYRVWTSGLIPKARKNITQGRLNFALLYDDYLHLYSSYGSKYGNKNLITDSSGKNTRIAISIDRYDEDSGEMVFTVDLPEEPKGDVTNGAEVKLFTDLSGRDYITFENSYRCGYAYILVTDANTIIKNSEELFSGNYGTTAIIPISFQKYVLPKTDGGALIYICFGDGENFSEVQAFRYGDAEPPHLNPLVYVLGGLGGLLVAAIIVAIIIIIRRKKLKKRR